MTDTVKVKYVGRYASGVILPLPDGTSIHAEQGAAITVPAGDFAAGLLVQETNWQPVGADAKEVAADAVAALPTADAAQTGG